MNKSIKISVQCYSGYKANERPVSFNIGKKLLKVDELVDTWHGVDHSYFKVLADDGNTYILKYEEGLDEWELEFFKDKRVK